MRWNVLALSHFTICALGGYNRMRCFQKQQKSLRIGIVVDDSFTSIHKGDTVGIIKRLVKKASTMFEQQFGMRLDPPSILVPGDKDHPGWTGCPYYRGKPQLRRLLDELQRWRETMKGASWVRISGCEFQVASGVASGLAGHIGENGAVVVNQNLRDDSMNPAWYTLAHEIGHLFGVDDHTGGVMNYYYRRSDVYIDGKIQFAKEYEHILCWNVNKLVDTSSNRDRSLLPYHEIFGGQSGNSPSGNSPSGNSPSGNSPSGNHTSGNPPGAPVGPPISPTGSFSCADLTDLEDTCLPKQIQLLCSATCRPYSVDPIQDTSHVFKIVAGVSGLAAIGCAALIIWAYTRHRKGKKPVQASASQRAGSGVSKRVREKAPRKQAGQKRNPFRKKR